ncbi:MAG: nucleotidyltransferase family protein [Methylococcales bacterium]|nr:nucleotidyltransferase family protein [Methylococcales bacterium]
MKTASLDSLKLLCQCISPVNNKEVILSQEHLSEIDWEAVVYCSGQHLVTPALCFYLKKKGLFSLLSKEVQEYLELIYDLNLTRNNKIKEQLLALLPDFNKAGIEPLLLKGIASLLGELYESPGIRVLGDIDILLPEDKLMIARSIMLEHGYTYTPGLHQDIVKKHKHLPAFVHDDQPVAIEIHRYPTALKYNNWVNNESAWNRCLTISLKSGVIRLPSSEFRLLHNFCHCQIDDKGYLAGYINARQLLEWVKLRELYEEEFDWLLIQRRVKNNRSEAAWNGYVLAAEKFFFQALIPNTTETLLTDFFMCRQQWSIRYPGYRKINKKMVRAYSFISEVLSVLLFNYHRGFKSFANVLWFSFKLMLSPKWYKKKWKLYKSIE